MTLGTDILATLPELRVQAESMMTGTCIITRSGERVFDETTGDYTSTSTPVYSGPCRVRFESAVATPVDAQSQVYIRQQPTLHLPVAGTDGIQVDDVATVGTLTLRIVGLHADTHATARRLPVELLNA